jgi:ribosomal protein S18 acetylase RimI-like enzyme
VTFTIRPATPADLDTVAAVWSAGWVDGHAGHVPDALVQHRRHEDFQALVATRIPNTIVIDDEAGVVGFVTVIDDQVEQIYVDRDARGKGASTTLLDYAETIIAANHQVAWLAVVSGNTRARRFYERNGWHDAGPLVYMAETLQGRLAVPTRRYEKRLKANI